MELSRINTINSIQGDISKKLGLWSSWVIDVRPYTAEVTGSNPVRPMLFFVFGCGECELTRFCFSNKVLLQEFLIMVWLEFFNQSVTWIFLGRVWLKIHIQSLVGFFQTRFDWNFLSRVRLKNKKSKSG